MFREKLSLVGIPIASTEYNIFGRRCAVFFLLALVLILPMALHADGLFDFQMKLAKRGNAEAQYKVGDMYDTGFGVKENRAEAEKWVTKAAGKGNEKAGFKLLYWDVEKNGLKGENKAKVDALVKKAEAGNSQAQYFVGKMHANGIGVKEDSDKAIGWLNKAAFAGVLNAERELAVVREDKQSQALSKRRAEEKQRAQLKADKERISKDKATKEKAKIAQQQRMLEAKRETEAKKKADAVVLEKIRQEDARKAKLLAQQEAEATAAKEAAAREVARKREAEKQAALKKKAEEKKRITFESDPCQGKSARFLSTCR